MANITIQNLEVESTALNQVSPSEMEKVVGGNKFFKFADFNDIVELVLAINAYLAFLQFAA
jgi:hypothetical protein